MDLLNGINLYLLQSGQVQRTLKKTICGDEEITEKTEVKAQKSSQLPANEVLNFMANQASMLKVDVSKSVQVKKIITNISSEEYERIGNIMKDFEENIENGMNAINSDFSEMNLSDNSKMKLLLQSMDKLA